MLALIIAELLLVCHADAETYIVPCAAAAAASASQQKSMHGGSECFLATLTFV